MGGVRWTCHHATPSPSPTQLRGGQVVFRWGASPTHTHRAHSRPLTHFAQGTQQPFLRGAEGPLRRMGSK